MKTNKKNGFTLIELIMVMIILGIDPGSRITGYGVIEQKGNKLTYIASGCIRLTGDELAGRLQQVFQGVSEIISQYQPK